MSGAGWAPGERGRAGLLSAVVLGAVLYPLKQYLRPANRRVDGFPLSHYPMFSARRQSTATVPYAVGVLAGGGRQYLPYRLLGAGGLNQVRRQLKRVLNEDRAEEFARTIAARASAEPRLRDVVRVEIVRGELDLDASMMSHQVTGTEEVLASAPLPRVAEVEEALAVVDTSAMAPVAPVTPGPVHESDSQLPRMPA
jgi:hypothetical protein